jgi:quinate/shikimate dehydrogenase (NAD+)
VNTAALIEDRCGRRGDEAATVVGLIGSGIGESLSPALHEREAALLGLDYSYVLLDLEELGIEPARVGELVLGAQEAGLRGLNITHPCKQLVIDHLDVLSKEAAALAAVNTITFDGDRVGHNTDLSGFREAFVRGLPDAATRRVVLMGAGGAGAAVGHAIMSLGARHLAIFDSSQERAELLADALCDAFGDTAASAAGLRWLPRHLETADGLIHATPTGMAAHPGSAVPANALRPSLWVAEVVYMPRETQLLKDATRRGCRTLDGLGMVALQAAGSLELFTGERADRNRMLRHVVELAGEEAADQRPAA